MVRCHCQLVTRSPCASERWLLVPVEGWEKIITRSAFALLGGPLTLAFYHFSQGATILAVPIVVCTDWIMGRMKDQLRVRRWHQMPRTCDIRHRRHTSIYIHILLQ
jgi:hypothetical protein